MSREAAEAAEPRKHQREAGERRHAEMEVEHGSLERWKVSSVPAGPWTPWRAGRYLPARWTSRIDGPHLPYVAELVLTLEPGGPCCESITYHQRDGGEPISPRRLRTMPAGALIDLAVSSTAARGEQRGAELRIALGGIGEVPAETRPLRERRSEGFLREVADVYLAAERHPTRAVQDHFASPSYSTAAHWVAKARAAKLIPPAKRGRGSAGKEL